MLIPSANFCCGSHPEHQAVRICVGPPKSDEELLRGARILRELIAKGPHTPVPIL